MDATAPHPHSGTTGRRGGRVRPAGWVRLDRYYLEEREHTIYYRQVNAERAVSMAGGHHPDSEASLRTRAYLIVKAWRGSGNATVALAPWLRAHDGETVEIVEPPEEYGIAIAAKRRSRSFAG